MCGIVGIIGSEQTSEKVLEGLKRLEYRGYDSAGIASMNQGRIELRRAEGKLSELQDLIANAPLIDSSKIAIGHTRWATHGSASVANAHPHRVGKCAVVHNGIIENHQEVRTLLQNKGVHFESETDTEVLPALINNYIEQGSSEIDAVKETLTQVTGAFAIAAVFEGNENMLIAARRGSPLVIGLGENTNYIGSDAIALASFTNKVIYLENDDMAVLTPTSVQIFNKEGVEVSRDIKEVKTESVLAEKNGFPSFMLKEIYEQPAVVNQTLDAYLNPETGLPELPFTTELLTAAPTLNIIACGTSYHAGLVAKYWIESLAKMPVQVDIASEFRYRNPPLLENGLSLFISQSGETADTYAALEYAKEQKQTIVSMVNVAESSIDRASDIKLYTKAGTEIGVASTKAFTTQLTLFALMAIDFALKTDKLTAEQALGYIEALKSTPESMQTILDHHVEIEDIAEEIKDSNSALFIGRGIMYPLALEGALKLKEISYIHAEGYAAGELKHGPIALIDEKMPTFALLPHNDLFEKTLSNLQEVQARDGAVYIFTDRQGKRFSGDFGEDTWALPDSHWFSQPIVFSISVQLLAYYTATILGKDVDKPRNLAKSVTVE